jgi:hypothetical protein
MADSREFATLTPEQLRKEADRRELVERHRVNAERRAARVALAEAIVALPAETVRTAGASHLLKNVLTLLVKADDDDAGVTNGEVSMAGYGAPENWWRDATAAHPKYDHDSILNRLRRHRVRLWETS